MEAMTRDELIAAQRHLGLTGAQFAEMLGLSPHHVLRLKAKPGASYAKAIQVGTTRLVHAYLAGYRPADWPKATRDSKTASRRRRSKTPPSDDVEARLRAIETRLEIASPKD